MYDYSYYLKKAGLILSRKKAQWVYYSHVRRILIAREVMYD